MKIFRFTFCFILILLSLCGCGKIEKVPETEVTISKEQAETETSTNEYGVLQDLIDSYGFPFSFRYTEGMELTSITINTDSATREWHTNNDNTTHNNLKWVLIENTLELSGDWTESFVLDMERGTATSLTNGAEYRFVVNIPNSIDTKWYVSWDTDVGFTEIDGVRQ